MEKSRVTTKKRPPLQAKLDLINQEKEGVLEGVDRLEEMPSDAFAEGLVRVQTSFESLQREINFFTGRHFRRGGGEGTGKPRVEELPTPQVMERFTRVIGQGSPPGVGEEGDRRD